MSDALAECSDVSAADLDALLALVAGTDIVELDLTVGGSRVSLRRPSPPRVAPAPAVVTGGAISDNSSLAIASPLVGVFHPAVKPGDTVSHGQVIGAIEALGMPTSIDAPQAGTVDDLLVQDGSPVEYGQALLVLRRAAHP